VRADGGGEEGGKTTLEEGRIQRETRRHPTLGRL
jgi:hypothetical protein